MLFEVSLLHVYIRRLPVLFIFFVVLVFDDLVLSPPESLYTCSVAPLHRVTSSHLVYVGYSSGIAGT